MLHNNLPDHSRVWVYNSARVFSASETEALRNEIRTFTEQWTSHKVGVIAEGDILHNRFVIFMVDEAQVAVGGCSIDSSVHFIKKLEKKFNTSLLNRSLVSFKINNEVCTLHRSEFEKLLTDGKVNDDTIVFNPLVQTKKELHHHWEIPYGSSWLKNVAAAHTSFNSIL